MKKLFSFVIMSFVVATSQSAWSLDLSSHVTSMQADEKVKKFVSSTLLSQSTHTAYITCVKEQNVKDMSLDKVKQLDEQWVNAEEEIPLQRISLNNSCAAELKKFVAAHPQISEAFVMDNKGAIVGTNSLTSDYWQGDEAKWQNSFNGGKGGIDTGKVKFDKSANVTQQQVSIPIIDGGQVIGAVTFGIVIDKL